LLAIRLSEPTDAGDWILSFFDELKRRNVFRVGVAYGIAGWVLLQIADLVLEAIEAPAWVLKALLLLIVLGFVAAIVIAWAYEMTPEGIKKESDVDRTASVSGATGKKLDKVIIGFLVVAVAVLLVERTMDRPSEPLIADLPPATPHISEQPGVELSQETEQTSVAVLPFANMSADADNEYFSDGISEELLNLLVRVKGLRVPSRTSSFAFKGMNMDIKEIARELEVGHILEGSVRKSGNQIRVTAQLIDVSTDTHLWSDTYDRELEDIFTIQDQIANSIVTALKDVLGTDVQVASRAANKPTENIDAYQDFLRGRQLFLQRGLESLYKSVELLRSAVAEDPQFAEAWAQLSMSATTLNGWDPLNNINANSLAVESGLKALQLDPESANAMAGLALAYYDQKRWVESFDLIEKAEPLAIDSTPVYWYGLLLQGAGYVEEARQKFMAAEEIDPFYPQLQYWIGLSDLAMGRPDLARARFQRAIEGNNPNGEYGMMMLSIHEGTTQELVSWLEATQRNLESGAVVSGLGDFEDFNLVIEGIQDPAKKDQAIEAASRLELITILTHLGALDEIMAVERRRLDRGNRTEPNNDLGIFFWSPPYQEVRQMEFFKTLLIELGLVELWKTKGWPDLCKPVGDDDFECD
jgi:TolB-like protein